MILRQGLFPKAYTNIYIHIYKQYTYTYIYYYKNSVYFSVWMKVILLGFFRIWFVKKPKKKRNSGIFIAFFLNFHFHYFLKEFGVDGGIESSPSSIHPSVHLSITAKWLWFIYVSICFSIICLGLSLPLALFLDVSFIFSVSCTKIFCMSVSASLCC